MFNRSATKNQKLSALCVSFNELGPILKLLLLQSGYRHRTSGMRGSNVEQGHVHIWRLQFIVHSQEINIISIVAKTYIPHVYKTYSFSFIFQCPINITVECFDLKFFVVWLTVMVYVFMFVYVCLLQRNNFAKICFCTPPPKKVGAGISHSLYIYIYIRLCIGTTNVLLFSTCLWSYTYAVRTLYVVYFIY